MLDEIHGHIFSVSESGNFNFTFTMKNDSIGNFHCAPLTVDPLMTKNSTTVDGDNLSLVMSS